MGTVDRTSIKRRGVNGSDEVSETLDWDARYGNIWDYKKQCKRAHLQVHRLCCVCLTSHSEQLHHAKYGNDVIGETVFPVCKKCHDTICHSSINWIKDKSDPVWGNQNTSDFIERLKLGYKLLYKGINHGAR